MKLLAKLTLGALLVGGTGSLIYAAPGDDALGTDTSITTSGTKQAVLSAEDMLVSSHEMIMTMHSQLRHVTQLRDKAAAEKDIIKLNCVNDKLMPMKAQVNLAEGSARQLEQTVSASDEQGRYASYSELTISNDKVKDLRDEADACVGDALTYVGKTDVQVTGPDNPLLPGDNTFGEGIEPPGYRTPFD